MEPTYLNVHNQFKINGFHLNREDMLRVAYSFIKEGEEYEKPVGDFIFDWFDSKPYLEVMTSGTTGEPKIIRISKQAMVNSAIATGNFFDINPGDKALHCLPVKYIAGKLMLIRAMILGLDIDFVAPASHPLDFNDAPKYDFVAMVPLQAKNSLQHLKKVKKLIVGGAKLEADLERELLKLPTQTWETYGMTETITHIAARKIGEEAFTVLPEITISYDDRNCLVIHAPKITEEVIVTNDLVELVNENQFVFHGRIDNVINSGGIKFMPEKIEEKLSGKIPYRYFITGKPDHDLGERICLVLESEPFAFDETIFELLDKYEKPKEIIFIPKFTETENGKIKRKLTLAE